MATIGTNKFPICVLTDCSFLTAAIMPLTTTNSTCIRIVHLEQVKTRKVVKSKFSQHFPKFTGVSIVIYMRVANSKLEPHDLLYVILPRTCFWNLLNTNSKLLFNVILFMLMFQLVLTLTLKCALQNDVIVDIDMPIDVDMF